ncbi:hypothetical protein QVD17_02252 [Tagetes erecta]|uniref:Uncharacterized protein n=1 Tax=Tagetes erecta TaxID=13708 RepID=A0AAD8P8V4_TARER|nr:hypothetical protein QVD17_02252 [Tagetes erecta]
MYIFSRTSAKTHRGPFYRLARGTNSSGPTLHVNIRVTSIEEQSIWVSFCSVTYELKMDRRQGGFETKEEVTTPLKKFKLQ